VVEYVLLYSIAYMQQNTVILTKLMQFVNYRLRNSAKYNNRSYWVQVVQSSSAAGWRWRQPSKRRNNKVWWDWWRNKTVCGEGVKRK